MAAKTLTDEQKQALGLMRERLGPVPDWLREHHKQLLRTKKAIRAVLKEQGAVTVPQVAEATGLDSARVFQTLSAMRKFGEVHEAGDDGDYPLYELVEDQGQAD